MMSSDNDGRAGRYGDRPEDRRGSCRYPVREFPAQLGWWETPESRRAKPSPNAETKVEPAPRPKVFDASTYSAIMSRGAAFRGGRSHLARQPVVESVHLEGQAAVSTPTRGNADPPVNGTLNGNGDRTNSGAQTPARVEPEATPRSDANASSEAKMQSCRAFILDLSHTGALLVCDAAPVEGQSVWVRLDGPETSAWVEGSLRGVSIREPGKFLVRLAFRDACPYDFFKAAVYGGFGKESTPGAAGV
jgi:hypothetical protein